MKHKRGMRKTKSARANWWLLGIYYLYLFVTWGLFRYTIKLDDSVEELVIKPVVWLLPLSLIFLGDKNRLRLFEGKLAQSVYWGLALGFVYFVANVVSGVVSGTFEGVPSGLPDFIGIGLITATTEEIVFSGFVFGNILAWTKKVYPSIVLSSVLFAIMHLPIGIFVYKYSPVNMGLFLSLVLLVNVMSNYLFYRTKNIAAPIISHWIWGVVAAIFR